ncbi:glycohydrolase toxin TNT-related protein [Desulfofarcimen acetoxidans]
MAPWFDQPGGGIQYEFSQSINNLLKAGIIKRVGP